ncbi:MAG: diguanylate cyclase [Candidatus Accumulibacter sp.]|nr:diguanylate cyclase [Accumulibacter sp.]
MLALILATRLDQGHGIERYALLGIGLLLVLTVLATFIFFARLRLLRTIIQRLEDILERYFHQASQKRSVPQNDECAKIGFALQLLEESMDARERSERELRQHEQINTLILNALPQSVIVANSRGCITLFSRGAETMLGYSADEIIGKQTPILFHDPEEIRQRAEELSDELCIPVMVDSYSLIAKALATGQVDEREWTYIRKDGARLTVLCSITVFYNDEGDVMCCCVATDVTERSRIAAEISRLANYDPLTQLPNRRLFHDRIHMAITQARRENTKFGLLMIDLDRFKPINDEYGHSAGDILLCGVAERMQKCLRKSDTLARVGGDEFVAILPMIEDDTDAGGVARKIRQSLCAPFELNDGIVVSIDCSIGIAIFPSHGDDEDSLLKSADDAMYVAKSLRRTRIYFAGGTVKTKHGAIRKQRGDGDGEPFTWRTSYQCGEEAIDRQHEAIFALSNSIILGIESGHTALDDLPAMLERFINDMREHLQYEEAVLSRLAYPYLDAHVLEHRALLGHSQKLHRLSVAGKLSLAEMASFVAWEGVVLHILIDDHEYFPFMKEALRQDSAETP